MKTILKIIVWGLIWLVLSIMCIGLLSVVVWGNLFITEPAQIVIRIFIIVCMILMPLSD